MHSFLSSLRTRLLKDWPADACAALFHLALIGLVLAVQAIAHEAARPDAYDYSPTPTALAQTRAEMDATLQARIQTAGSFEALVHQALAEGRVDVARGLLLAQTGALPDADFTALKAALPSISPEDVQLLRDDAADSASQSPREATLVLAPIPSGEVRSYAADELRSLMRESARWLLGQPGDPLALRLLGLQLVSPGDDPLNGSGVVREAARLIRIARRSGKLQPELEAHLEQRALAALPDEALRRELLRAFGREIDRTAPTAVADSFAAARQPDALLGLMADLEALAALRRSMPQAGALLVLAQVERPQDLPRLQLLALAGGERLPALLALEPTDQVWSTVRGRLRETLVLKRLRLACLAAVVLGFLACAGGLALQLRARPTGRPSSNQRSGWIPSKSEAADA